MARQLATLVLCSRPKFGKIYDATITELGNNVELFKVAILDENLESPANDVQAFTTAFRRAIDANWHRLLLNRAIQQDAVSKEVLEFLKPQAAAAAPAVAPPQPAAAPAAPAAAAAGNGVQLQGIMNPAGGINGTNAEMSGYARTTPKICLIKVTHDGGLPTTGSGFLIGPQAVLTAWHVIETLLDPATGKEKPGSHNRLEVIFDYMDAADGYKMKPKSYRVRDDWLGDHSLCPAAERPNDKGLSDALQAGAVNDTDLDFAVIRLRGSPGRDRGVVELNENFLTLPKKGSLELYVFQHPNNFPQGVDRGVLAGFFGTGDPPPRLRHSANTLPGSSGGLCVDRSFKGIGLHQAAVFDAAGTLTANQAVPIAHICKKLPTARSFNPQFDLLWRLNDAAQTPVIGREIFQEAVWRATGGEKRVILVRGGPKTGVEFSAEILRSLRPPNDADVVRISADEIATDAIDFAGHLLGQVGGKLQPGESFTKRDDAATADAAWVRDRLVKELVVKVHAGNGGKTVWVVVDNLFNFEPTDGPARKLLLALICETTDAPAFRFLLLGFRGNVPDLAPDLVDEDIAGPPTTTDIERYVRRFATEHNKTLTNNQLQDYVAHFMDAFSQSPAENPWRLAARYGTGTFRRVMLGGN